MKPESPPFIGGTPANRNEIAIYKMIFLLQDRCSQGFLYQSKRRATPLHFFA
jgi:hypothetical protein